MAQNVLSIRIKDEVSNRLDRLTEKTKRSRSFLAAEAISEYLERHEWQITAIDDAVEKADEGKFVSHEATSEWLQSWGETETQTPTIDTIK